MNIEVWLFDELVETFDLGNPGVTSKELRRLVAYLNYHSRNRRYQLSAREVILDEKRVVPTSNIQSA